MVGTLARVSTLLIAVAILLTGHGLQQTLLPVFALDLGWSPTVIGLTGSAYFIGFVSGCIVIPGIVAGVGHIRTFMVMAAAVTIALLSTYLLTEFWAWLLFRAAIGFALAGLYMVIESWLGDVTPRDSRGTVLATYSVISLAGLACGQLLMGAPVESRQSLFIVAAILVAIAIIPIGLTQIASPHPVPSIRFRPTALLRASRVSIVCAGLAGLVTSVFWSLGPLLANAFGTDPDYVGLLMSSGIAGAAICHLPLGRLSDHFDRRSIIGSVAAAGAAVGIAAAFLTARNPAMLYVSFFFLGATSMPLYSLCIALACDQGDMSLVEATSSVLLINGLSSIVGPMIAAAAMSGFGASAYFAYCGVCLSLAALWTAYRVLAVERHPSREVDASMLPRTTQAIAGLAKEEPDA